jgi:hypothetical protein
MASSSSSSASIPSIPRTKSRGKLWSEEMTKFLIQSWGEETIQEALNNSKSSKQTRGIYDKILVGLSHVF